MLSLLLDSANKDLCVGVAKDGKVIDKTVYGAWQRQSEYMVPEITKIFEKNGINPKDITEILVTEGPGSYTGVRIALTIAKVYAYVLSLPVYLFSSLQVISDSKNISICLINAKSNRSYFAVYKGNEVLEKDQVLTNEQVKSYIQEHPDFKLCGELDYLGLDGYKADVLENMLLLKDETHKCENILKLKAVYLKDENEYTKSK